MKIKNILVSLFFFALMLILVSCAHNHTYNEEWAKNDTHHWHNATCDHSSEVDGFTKHKYDNGVITVNASCTTLGVKIYTCVDCGATKEEYIAVLGHDEVARPAQKPTCTEVGWGAFYECLRCDYSTKEEIPALGHTAVTDEVVSPTCTDSGLTEGSHCKVCHEVLVAQDVVNATGHTNVVREAVAATCTNKGLSEGSFCLVCREVLVEQTEVAALGHTPEADPAVVPSCVATGLTEGSHCSVCHELLEAQTIVPEIGHTKVVDAAVEATCTENGKTEGSHCSVCFEVFLAQKTVQASGHTIVKDAAVAPTCTVPGMTNGTHCSVCNTVLIAQEVVAALGHTEVVEAGYAATCTESGLSDNIYCSACDTILQEQKTIPALGHTYSYDYLTGIKVCDRCEDTIALTKSTWALPGSFNDWSQETKFYETENPNVVRIDLNLSKITTYKFKVTLSNTWYGNNGTISASTWPTSTTGWKMDASAGDCGLYINAPGVYAFEFNTSTKAIYVSGGVSVIGTVNGNWDTDTAMTYQGNGVFTVDMTVAKGYYEYKVRLNGEWNKSYGKDCADNNGNAVLNATVDGTYRFTIDFINKTLTAVLVD